MCLFHDFWRKHELCFTVRWLITSALDYFSKYNKGDRHSKVNIFMNFFFIMQYKYLVHLYT
jgi:hypothetical protein